MADTDTYSEELTQAEIDYFNSRGENTQALTEAHQEPQERPDDFQGGAVAGDPTQPSGDPQEDDYEEGEIYLDENGRAKDAKTGKFVPHAALHKERERHKQTKTELELHREKMARAEERLAILNEVLSGESSANGANQPGAQAQKSNSVFDEEPIDPSVDFVGAVDQIRRQQAEMRNGFVQSRQELQQKEAVQQMQQLYYADATRYAQENPNFKDAYFHLVEGRHRELEAMGMKDKGARDSYIAQEEQALVAQAINQGMSPSQAIYNIAIARGFSPQQAAQAADQATGQANSGYANGGNAYQAPNASGAEKINNIRRGREANQTLSRAGGSSGEGLTYEALANMSEEEFASVASKLGKSKLRQILGG